MTAENGRVQANRSIKYFIWKIIEPGFQIGAFKNMFSANQIADLEHQLRGYSPIFAFISPENLKSTIYC